MCEFKVYLKKENKEETVAEDIVYAKNSEGSVVLKTILGNQITIDNADIIEVDVEAERLVLSSHTHCEHHHH
jgi:predicted RNA-binding protein